MFCIAASSRRATSRLATSSRRARAVWRVEVGGELRAVGVERVHLLGQRRRAAIDFDSALDRNVERVQRRVRRLVAASIAV